MTRKRDTPPGGHRGEWALYRSFLRLHPVRRRATLNFDTSATGSTSVSGLLERRDPPFFIVGVARSGTTLLRTMLNRHPVVAIPPESHFIPRLWRRRWRYRLAGPTGRVEAFLRDLEADPRFRTWDLPIGAVRQELDGSPPVPESIDAVFHAYARRHAKTRWGDKTPRYAWHLRLLSRLFPEARFVHLIRDGRDVALSMMDRERVSKHRDQPSLHRHAASPALFWSRRVRRARRAGGRMAPGRYLELRYEDLVRDSEAQLRRLCEFLQLEFAPQMLQHGAHAVTQVPPSQQRAHRRLGLPVTAGLRDWRTQMAAHEAAEFEAIAGRELSALGYELSVGRSSGLARWRAWWQVLDFATRHRVARIRRWARRRHMRGRGPAPGGAR